MSFIKESKNAYKKVQENHIAIAMGKMLDDEGGMILNQLEELERAIEMIRTYVGTDYEKQLPAWVQAKVTLATDYISTVGNYLSSKNEKVTEEAIKEEFDLKETSLTAIHKMKEDGKTSEEIAKELKLNAGLVKKILGEEVEIQEATPLQTSITMMKTLAAKAGIKPATSNNGYQAIYDYKNGEGSFKGQGKKSYEQVKNWIYKNGYIVQTDYLKQIMGEEAELQEKPKVKKQKDQTNNIPQNIEPTNASGANTQVGLSMGEEVELKPVPSLEDSAKKHNVDIEALKKQLEKGIKSESEHTDDPKIAEKIALAHLDERPDYYDQLDKMEKLPVKDIEEHIVKVKSGYELKSKSTGKNLGTYPTKAGAEKRERQVQYFKHQHEEVKEPTGELKDACWTGYVAVGTKMKNGKRVPNCVPKSEAYKGAKSIVEKAWKKLKEKK